MNTVISNPQELQNIREKIAHLKNERYLIITDSYVSSKRKQPDLSSINKEIDNLYKSLPEYQDCDEYNESELKGHQSDIQQFQTISNPDNLKSALLQLQDLQCVFRRLDLQGHCKGTVKQLNIIERDILATLSDLEES